MKNIFIEISRRQSHEYLPSRKFIRLFTLPYKRQGKAGDWVIEVQLVLCEDAVRLKRLIRYKVLSNNFLVYWYRICKGYKQRNYKQSNCCCLHQVVNSGTQNCVNNKTKHKIYFYFICNLCAHILNVFKMLKCKNRLCVIIMC